MPKGNKVPNFHIDCKNVSRDIGLLYEKIDACVNDCILYKTIYEKAQSCLTCGEFKWKNFRVMENMASKHDHKKILHEVL